MAQIIKPQSTKIITKNGECHIKLSLELNINLNSDNLKVGIASSGAGESETAPKKKVKEEDEVDWIIPDFSSGNLANFGKEVK